MGECGFIYRDGPGGSPACEGNRSLQLGQMRLGEVGGDGLQGVLYRGDGPPDAVVALAQFT